MDNAGLPAAILLYVAGATAVVNILVNGIRTAVVLPAIVSFLGACLLGIAFVLLFMVANGVVLTMPLVAGSVIAGVLVGGASAGSNAVHSRSQATDPPMEADEPQEAAPLSDDDVERVARASVEYARRADADETDAAGRG